MPRPPTTAESRAVDDLFINRAEAKNIHADYNRYWLTTFTGNLLASVVSFSTTLVLARLLSPTDFGVIAMVTGVIGVGHLLRNMGLTTATVRHPNITPQQISVLFWINLSLGLAITSIVILTAPLIGQMYGDERLPLIAMVLAFSFVLSALSGHHQALLNRNLRFYALARMHFLTTLASSAIALMLAYHGHGYWAMVLATVSQSLITALLSWSICPWRPGLPRRGTGAGAMIKFGSYILAFGLLSFAAKNVHNIALGIADGAAAVGLFNRALQLTILLTGMITGALGTVAIATLSKLAESPAEYRRHFRDIVARIALMSAPLSVLLFVQADQIIPVLFGSQWQDSILLLRILSASIVIKTLFPTAGWLHLSRGDARGMMRWGAIGWSVHISFAVVGIQFGLVGIATATICSHFILILPTLRAAMKNTTVTFTDIGQSYFAPLSAAFAAAPVFLLWFYLDQLPVAGVLVALSACYLIAYVAILMNFSLSFRVLIGSIVDKLRLKLGRLFGLYRRFRA